MSSLRLQYPLKPHEIADDLESFIYVIVYMAFRFHRHHLTPPNWKDLDTYAKQVQANADNERLAKAVDNFFYEDFITHGGLFVGGHHKSSQIRDAKPPLVLAPGRSGPTMLGEFLSKAYKLLHQHSLTVNESALARYAVEPLDESSDTSDSPGPSARQRNRNNIDILPFIRILPPGRRGYSPSTALQPVAMPSSRSPSKSLNKPSSAEKPSPGHVSKPVSERSETSSQSSSSSARSSNSLKPSAVLADHNALLELFISMFMDADNKPRDLFSNDNVDEKIFDQFDGLKAFVAIELKNSSGRTKSEPKNGSTSSKSSSPDASESSDSEPAPPAKPSNKRKRDETQKKPPNKRVRLHGQISLANQFENVDGREDQEDDDQKQDQEPAPQARYALRSAARKQAR